MSTTTIIPRNSIQFLCYFFCGIIVYFLFSNGTPNQLNPVNILLQLVSLTIIWISIESIKRSGLKLHNWFFLVFNFFLLLNTYHISNLQREKEFIDLYYLLVGPSVFGCFLYLGENVKISGINFNLPIKLNPNIISLLLMVIYMYILWQIYTTVGFRLFSDTLLRYQDKSEFIVPGMSGALAIIKWILLMMIPYVTKSLRYAIIISLILFSGVMQFNRGDIFRVSIFMALFYMVNREKKLVTKNKLIILLTVAALGITSFAWIGEFRQSDELNTFDIGYLMDSRVDNIAFNWLYSYSAINFDVLKLVTESEAQNFPYTVFSLFIYYLGDRNFIEELESDRASFSLSGLNASTFLSPFVQDMGAYYIIELIVFGALMSLFIIFIKAQRLTGVYLFIMLLVTLTISGNYLIVPNFVAAILLATFLGMLVRV